MKRCILDKIASVTKRIELTRNAVLSTEIPAQAGTVIAARVLNAKTSYDTLEDVHGRFVRLHPGDVIAGALGHRDALHGFSGVVPAAVAVGDHLQLLNKGGVIGAGAEATPGVGDPFELEVLGAVVHFPDSDRLRGEAADVTKAALPPALLPSTLPPIVCLLGTAMDSGKTTAASVLITSLTHSGKRVAAGKLTGVSLRRDILAMSDCGASPAMIFTDFGVVTTDEANALQAAHSLLANLVESEPDVIVLELGDGLLGTYGVHTLLSDPGLRAALSAIVLCASDPVGTWGAATILHDRYSLAPTVVSGPVTDTPVGRRYCTEHLQVPAHNALLDPGAFSEAVTSAISSNSTATTATNPASSAATSAGAIA
jgi:hypothetical protein